MRLSEVKHKCILTSRTREQDMRVDTGSTLTWHIAAKTINKKVRRLHARICSAYVRLMKREAWGKRLRSQIYRVRWAGFLCTTSEYYVVLLFFFSLEVNGSLLPYVTSRLLAFWPWVRSPDWVVKVETCQGISRPASGWPASATGAVCSSSHTTRLKTDAEAMDEPVSESSPS